MNDKKLHWIVGLILTIIFYFVAFFVALNTGIWDVWLAGNSTAAGFILLLIFGKEIFDSVKGSINKLILKLTGINIGWKTTGFSWADIKFGVGGAVVGLIVSNILAFIYLILRGLLW